MEHRVVSVSVSGHVVAPERLGTLRDVLARHTVTRDGDGSGRCAYCNERVEPPATGCTTAIQVRGLLAASEGGDAP